MRRILPLFQFQRESAMSNTISIPKMKLGFGLMRLPKNEDGSIDIPQTADMVDLFMEAGGTYFDTAFAYQGSEEAIRKTLIERYPRESFTLADKMICVDPKLTEQDVKQEFATSLERTGAGYFDYYLVHAIQRINYERYDSFGIWDYVKEQKEKGLIRHLGFSFHADPELLEELLEKHPEIEFVQLQLNYADWENPGVNSRRNWELCRSYGKLVSVMEPVKGGILADPIDAVKAIFDKADSSLSYASWAIRFAAGLPDILTVLSGMSSLAQMKDNLSYMKDFKPFSPQEQAVLEDARHAIDADQSIPCTACHYCTKGCPMEIPIPEIFTVKNRMKGSPGFRTRREYEIVTREKGSAADCVQCGQCEMACPQHLPIIDLLKVCRGLADL